MEEKLGSIKTYREHLHDQYVDRSVQWTLSELSADPDSGVLTVLVDGMDQAKFRLPKHPQHRAIASMQAGFQIKSFFFQYITVNKFNKKFIIIIDVVLVCATKAYPRATVIRPCLKLHAAWAVGCSSTFGNYFNPLSKSSKNYIDEPWACSPRMVPRFICSWWMYSPRCKLCDRMCSAHFGKRQAKSCCTGKTNAQHGIGLLRQHRKRSQKSIHGFLFDFLGQQTFGEVFGVAQFKEESQSRCCGPVMGDSSTPYRGAGFPKVTCFCDRYFEIWIG